MILQPLERYGFYIAAIENSTKMRQKKIEKFNLNQEWNFLFEEFYSRKFRSYTDKQRTLWYCSQLLLIVIEGEKNIKIKSELQKLLLDFKKRRQLAGRN
jgi:hypothetical protein